MTYGGTQFQCVSAGPEAAYVAHSLHTNSNCIIMVSGN